MDCHARRRRAARSRRRDLIGADLAGHTGPTGRSALVGCGADRAGVQRLARGGHSVGVRLAAVVGQWAKQHGHVLLVTRRGQVAVGRVREVAPLGGDRADRAVVGVGRALVGLVGEVVGDDRPAQGRHRGADAAARAEAVESAVADDRGAGRRKRRSAGARDATSVAVRAGAARRVAADRAVRQRESAAEPDPSAVVGAVARDLRLCKRERAAGVDPAAVPVRGQQRVVPGDGVPEERQQACALDPTTVAVDEAARDRDVGDQGCDARLDVKDPVTAVGVDHGRPRAGAGDRDALGQIEIAGGRGVFTGAGDRQPDVAGRNRDRVATGAGVGRTHGLAQRAVRAAGDWGGVVQTSDCEGGGVCVRGRRQSDRCGERDPRPDPHRSRSTVAPAANPVKLWVQQSPSRR